MKELVANLRAQCENEKRRSGELFAVVERVIEEREQWKGMFLEQASQHETAQAMLVRAMQTAQRHVGILLAELNRYRAAESLPKLLPPPPSTIEERLPEAYHAAVEKMKAKKQADCDAIALRDAVR